MPAHEVYDYAVVRVMPRVEREEFVNAGVIISCQRTGHLQAAIALDEARLLALDPNVDMETVHRHLGAIVAICEGAAHGGPIALLQDGDIITVDAVSGELSVALTDDELAERKAKWKGPRPTQYTTGAIWKFAKLVGGARWGAVSHPGAKAEKHVYMDQ